jgi:hypothetical protein
MTRAALRHAGGHGRPQLLLHPGIGQRLVHPPRTIAAPLQPAGLDTGIGGIVDIAQFDITGDEGGQVRRLGPIGPAALGQLARQVAFQLARRSGVAGDIGQR